MTPLDIASHRLYNQQIGRTRFEKPGETVAWLGAVQAQDYLGALWAIGLRTRHTTEEDIEQAIADKAIIRTWPMRGTLHIVAAEDIRWMLALTAPRVIARSALRYRQLELDDATLVKSNGVLVRALHGGKQLTRAELASALEQAGISTAGQRLSHILQRAEIEGLICYGVRRGKQFTFALLDEWLSPSRTLERDEALAELAGRYFTSHGPATLQDFVWRSGLTSPDARAGLEMVKSRLAQEVAGGQTYWLPRTTPTVMEGPPNACLLPAFDEYLVGYKDRSAVLDPAYTKSVEGGMLSPTMVVDGYVVGTWKRTLKKDSVVISPSYFTKLSGARARAMSNAIERYSTFVGMSPSVDI